MQPLHSQIRLLMGSSRKWREMNKKACGVERPGLEPLLCPSLAGQPHQHHTASLSLSSLVQDMEILTATAELRRRLRPVERPAPEQTFNPQRVPEARNALGEASGKRQTARREGALPALLPGPRGFAHLSEN